ELLTGRNPFRRDTAPETLTAILREDPPVGEGIPPLLRRVASRCLEKSPDDRYGSTRDLARDLRDADLSSASSAAAVAPARRSRLAPAVAALALVVGIAFGWMLRRLTSSGAAPEEPIHVHPLTYSGRDFDPAASPDGRLIAFTSQRDGVSRIWLRQLIGGGEAPLTAGPDGHARFSPDGASLLFIRDVGVKQAVYRIGLVGGEPRRLVDDATAADWSPDGRKIVFARERAVASAASEIGILDLATGEEKVVARLGGQLILSPRWSPDGRTIAFSSGGYATADWKLQTIDVESGKVTSVPPGNPGIVLGGLAWSGAGEEIFYVQASAIMGDIVGSGSRVIRRDVRSGRRRTLYWADGLSWSNSSAREIAQIDVAAPGRLLFGQRLRKQNLREAELDASGAASVFRVLATGSSIDRQPVYSPDGKEILFSSNRGGNLDLWAIDRATGVIRQITDDPANDWDPAYMPDGKHILWGSDRGTGHLEIWTANTDGSGAHQVTRDGVSAQNPVPSPDGRWIFYWSSRADRTGLWKVRSDGTSAVFLERADPAVDDGSPDGRYILFPDQDRLNLRNIIRVFDVETGRLVPFSIDVRYGLGAPTIIWGRARWSADSRKIYFVAQDRDGLSGIFVQDFDPVRDTSSSRRKVAGFSRDFITESFGLAPDGKRIVISTGEDLASVMVAEDVPGALPPVRGKTK
ncbi:MAG TPA: hypothetical protein VFL12_08810, partial [Thermoanaerobaculia bacterium]|nr:hypothetical protein [Thermoanaerobaculia bacterium]